MTVPLRSPREERTTATFVGLLYTLATAAGVSAALLNAPTDLGQMAAHKGAVLATALLCVVMAGAVTGVAVMLYPVIVSDARSRAQQGLALWYVATRIAEGTLFFVAVLFLVSMLGVSEALASSEVFVSGALTVALNAAYEYAWIAGQTVFCIGAVMLYALLLVSRRVPSWLSVWGLIAAVAMLVAGFLLPFSHEPNAPVAMLLYAPMALQEMVLAGWLIFRGFSPTGPRTPVRGRAGALA
jgi:hypothetical protein